MIPWITKVLAFKIKALLFPILQNCLEKTTGLVLLVFTDVH